MKINYNIGDELNFRYDDISDIKFKRKDIYYRFRNDKSTKIIIHICLLDYSRLFEFFNKKLNNSIFPINNGVNLTYLEFNSFDEMYEIIKFKNPVNKTIETKYNIGDHIYYSYSKNLHIIEGILTRDRGDGDIINIDYDTRVVFHNDDYWTECVGRTFNSQEEGIPTDQSKTREILNKYLEKSILKL